MVNTLPEYTHIDNNEEVYCQMSEIVNKCKIGCKIFLVSLIVLIASHQIFIQFNNTTHKNIMTNIKNKSTHTCSKLHQAFLMGYKLKNIIILTMVECIFIQTLLLRRFSRSKLSLS